MHVADLSGTVCAAPQSQELLPDTPILRHSAHKVTSLEENLRETFEISGGKVRRWLNGQATGPVQRYSSHDLAADAAEKPAMPAANPRTDL